MLQAFTRTRPAFTRPSAWLLSLLVVVALLLSPAADFLAQAAVNDAPTPFITDGNIEEWSVGAGLVYWANNCFGDEFNPIAELRRKPAGGGPQQVVQAIDTSVDPDKECNTFANQLSSGDGLFYYEDEASDGEQDRIMRMPLGGSFVPRTVKSLAFAEVPNSGRAFVEDDDYIYWPVQFTNKIFRTRKNGNGPIETVAETNPSPFDVIVVGTTVYWTDSVGVFGKSIACDELPCDGQEKFDDFSNGEAAYGLIYRPTSGFFPGQNGFRLYWVQRIGGNYKIVYRACILIAPDPPNPTPEPEPPVTFYAASPNRVIGNLVLANDNIFWTEYDGTNGDIYRKPFNASLDTPPGNIATTQTGIDNQLYVVGNNLFFARNTPGDVGDGIYTLPLDATAITRDFSLEAFEVTQGVQNLANETPLVGKKTTYVRAYARQVAGPSTSNVEVHLIGTRNDLDLPGSPLKPVNGVRALTTGGSFDRARLNDSWYFLLPPSWTEPGNIQLQLVIDPRHLHTDPDLTNNIFPQTGSQQFNFQNQPPVCVMTVPIRTHNPLPSVYDPNVGLMVSNFDRRWPVPETWIFRDTEPDEELEICTWHYIPYPCFGPYELSDGWGLTNGIPDRDKVIVSLWTRALLSFNPDACDDIGAPVHFMGMVHPDADNGGAAGYASTVSNQSWVQLPEHGVIASDWNAMEEGSTMAQELAHNHGRKHVNCGGPDDIDGSYPYPPCQIAPTGADSFYGFDIASRRPIRPDRAADFMSYANDTWVSDYTWKALLGKFASTSVASVAPLATDQGEQVFVTGMVDGENARGEITIVLNVPAASLPPETRQMAAVSAASVQHDDGPHVNYSLRLLDADGEVIQDRPLALLPLDDHSDESQAALFVEQFPKPAAQVAQIQLLAGGNVMISDTIGINMPVVAIQEPAAGEVVEDALTIQWTASDPDADDRLKFTLQYSHDNGASWRTMAINRPSTPDLSNSLTISVAGVLHGSVGNTALVRVLASDGYNTQVATSPAFTVKNSPPFVAITAPSNGQTLAGGEAVLLQGTATDPEDGGLDTSGLRWQVDGINVGNGTTVAVDGLASMAHTAALAATDANSQTVTTTVSFTLAPLSIPHAAAPTLDGSCNDASYTASVSLPLSAYADTTEATVRLLRSDDYLWACFANLKSGAEEPGAYVGLRADIDNSRNPLAQATDAGFFVGENGDVYTMAGNGAGDFVAPGPDGLQGQVVIDMVGWSAELRIDKESLGGWGHVINVALGQHSLTAEDDDYLWPHPSMWGEPDTWSAAALGTQPVITMISPSSSHATQAFVASTASMANASAAVVLGPSLAITIEGSNLVSGTQVLWNGNVLPTTWITTEVLSAMVTDTLLSTAGVAQITARSLDKLLSNQVAFVVEAPAPVITSLSPDDMPAGSNSFELTINGSNFAPDATVLWNGVALTAQFVNALQLKVQINGALLETGQEIGVAVENPTPTAQLSSVVPFTILPPEEEQSPVRSYMPGLYKQP